MSKYRTLLYLQVKAAALALPKIFAGTLVFSLVMVLAAVGGTYRAAHSGAQNQRMQIALVMPPEENEENRYVRMAFAFLGEIDTVKTVCDFVPAADEQTAVEQLRRGENTAVVVIPERFISGIMNGENTPARIIFGESGANTSSALFQEMLRAGASDLSTAQAGIYAVEDVSRFLSGSPGAVEQASDYLNNRYFSYALDRNIYYETVPVSSEGSLSTVQFYTAAGLVLLFLLSAIPCAQLLKPPPPVLSAAMRRRGIQSGVCRIFQVSGVTLVCFALFGTAYVLAALATIRYPSVGTVIGFPTGRGGGFSVLSGLAGLLVLLFSVFAFAGLIYRLAGRTVPGVLLLFLLSVVLLFAAGCFVPSALLPPLLSKLGALLPTAFFFRLCGQILTGTVGGYPVFWNLVYAAAFFAVSAMIEKRAGLRA